MLRGPSLIHCFGVVGQRPPLAPIEHSSRSEFRVNPWGSWAVCSLSCGSGSSYRRRTVKVSARFGGKQCPGLGQTRKCNTQACPVDCVVSSWSAWSACSLSSGGSRGISCGRPGPSQGINLPPLKRLQKWRPPAKVGCATAASHTAGKGDQHSLLQEME